VGQWRHPLTRKRADFRWGLLITRTLGHLAEEGRQLTACPPRDTMPAVMAAGAPSHDPVTWHTIDWYQAHRTVRRLQARIVKATQEGRWGKVKALQHLLTHSLSGKALAVRRVTENHGKTTAGVDRVIWNTPEKKAAAITALTQRGYHPQPVRRVYIPKRNGTKRPLGIATMHDRAMQTLYLFALQPIAETTGDANSYGFRPDRSPADAIEQCHTDLSKHYSAPWILEGDIRACFDGLSHQWLVDNVPLDRAMLHKWLKAGVCGTTPLERAGGSAMTERGPCGML